MYNLMDHPVVSMHKGNNIANKINEIGGIVKRN